MGRKARAVQAGAAIAESPSRSEIERELAEIGDPYAERARLSQQWQEACRERDRVFNDLDGKCKALRRAVLEAQEAAEPAVNRKAELERQLRELDNHP